MSDEVFEWRGKVWRWNESGGEQSRDAQRMKDTRDQRRAAGLCVRCGEPAKGETSRCESCWARHRKYESRRESQKRKDNPYRLKTSLGSDLSRSMREQVEAGLARLESECSSRPDAGFTYTLRADDPKRLIKIGKTDQERPWWRLAGLQTQNAAELTILSICHGITMERQLQRKHSEQFDHGEWYRLDDDPMPGVVDGLCAGCRSGASTERASMRDQVLGVLESATEPMALSAIAERTGRYRAVSLVLDDLAREGVIVASKTRVWDGRERKWARWSLAGREVHEVRKGDEVRVAVLEWLDASTEPLSPSKLARQVALDPFHVRRALLELAAAGEIMECFPPSADGHDRKKPLYASARFDVASYVARRRREIGYAYGPRPPKPYRGSVP